MHVLTWQRFDADEPQRIAVKVACVSAVVPAVIDILR